MRNKRKRKTQKQSQVHMLSLFILLIKNSFAHLEDDAIATGKAKKGA